MKGALFLAMSLIGGAAVVAWKVPQITEKLPFLKPAPKKVLSVEEQRRECLEARRSPRHLLGEEVVRSHRHVACRLWIGNRLDRRGVERQDHHFHAVLVHLAQTVLLEVQQPLAEFLPVVAGDEARRVLQRLWNGEMLFQPDLSVHVVHSCDVVNTNMVGARRAPVQRKQGFALCVW